MYYDTCNACKCMYLFMSCVARTCASLVRVILDMHIMIYFLWYIWFDIGHTPAGVMSWWYRYIYIYIYIYIYMYYDMYDTCVYVDMCIHMCAGVPCVNRSRHTPVRFMSAWSMYTYTYKYYDMNDTCKCMYIRMHNCAAIRLMCLIHMWIVHIYQIYEPIYMYIYT